MDRPQGASRIQSAIGKAPESLIGMRWWIGEDNTLNMGWPEPGKEADCAAIGWVAADQAFGVIDAPSSILGSSVLDVLEAKFPHRRWYQGAWDEATTSSKPARVAA